MAQEKINIAHWVMNFSHPVASLDAWIAMVKTQMEKAATEGMDILLLPEHTSEQWMSFCPDTVTDTEELDWIAEQAPKTIQPLQDIVNETGVALVTGSTSWKHADTGNNRNRAWMLFPDRDPIFHDKLVLTPSEKDCNGWEFETGNTVNVFEWRGFKMSLIICLDVEMPALSHVMSDQDIDLLLVPSMTTKKAGYYRVFNCAQARAVELMTAVAVVGCVGGGTHKGTPREIFHSGAALYLPSEELFGHTGVFGNEIDLHGSIEGVGEVLYSRDIPLKQIRDIRHGKAEAWPGSWPADHIEIKRS